MITLLFCLLDSPAALDVDEPFPVLGAGKKSSALLNGMDVAVAVALLADMDTRQLYYAKNAVERRYPASITKVMTTLLTLDRGRKAIVKVRQNIVIPLLISFGAILLSAFGVPTPVTAVLVHNFGSVFVVINAVLLLRGRDVE